MHDVLGRHIGARILSGAAILLTVVTVALTTMQFVRLGPLFLGPWVRLHDASCLVAVLPFLTLALPASVALATAAVAATLTRRGERATLAASGVPLGRILAAPVLVSVVAALLTALLSVVAGPWAFGVLGRGLASLATRAALESLPEGRFFDLPGSGTLYARRRTVEGGRTALEDVVLGITDDSGAELTVSARRAVVVHSGAGRCTFELQDAVVRTGGWSGAEMQAEVSSLSLPLDLGAFISSRADTLPAVLATPTDRLDPAGTDLQRYHLHRRLSVPLASLAVLLMASFTFVAPRLRRPWAAPVAVASALVGYHAVMRAAEEVAMRGFIPVEAGAWLPAGVMCAACAVTLARMARPSG